MSTYKTNKRLQRLILDRAVAFGPKRKGPNILLNKFITRDSSFFSSIQKLAEQYLIAEHEKDEIDETKIARHLKLDSKHEKSVEEVL